MGKVCTLNDVSVLFTTKTKYVDPKRPFTLYVFMHFCLQFDANAKNRLYTHSLGLTQHPIDVMLQFDANAGTDANLDASANGLI